MARTLFVIEDDQDVEIAERAYHVLNHIAQYEQKTLSDTVVKHSERISFVLQEKSKIH